MFIKQILSFGLLVLFCNNFAIAADLQILDYFNQPVKGVNIFIYNNKKLINKKIITDANGRVPKKALSVVFETLILTHPQFVKKTLLNVSNKSNPSIIYLNKKSTKQHILKGKTLNFSGIKRDGLVDFGLSLFSLNHSELWNIDPTYFFSTNVVPVPSFTKLNVPDNISLPNQKERYFFAIHLKKENYTLEIPKNKKYNIHTLHGTFPLKKAISKIRSGGGFISLVNLFTFKAYSGTQKDFTKAKGTDSNFDLSQNTIDSKITIKTKVNLLNNEVLVLSLERNQGQYLPFDIKQLIYKESFLAVPKDTTNSFAIGLLTQKIGQTEGDEDEFSAQAALVLNLQEKQMLQSTGLDITNMHAMDMRFVFNILFNNRSTVKLKINTKSNFLSATQLSIALQKTVDQTAELKFLPLIEKPKINKAVVDLVLPTLSADFKAHSSILQLVEIKTVFIDKKKRKAITQTTVIEQVGVSHWQKQFSMDFFNQFKKDPSKKYAIQIIFLASSANSVTPTYATRSLSKLTH